jgi:hypothetical protein
MKTIVTPFEQAQEAVRNGKLTTPTVVAEGKQIDYFGYQISVHRFNLRIMAGDMKFRGVKLRDLKNYYGLTGRSASECLAQFENVVADYRRRFNLLQSVNKN